jgi:hypothetical protein
MNQSNFTSKEYPPLNDVLLMHLNGCEKCQESLKDKPVPNVRLMGMRPSKLCSEWYEIIEDYAQYEGQVNNIVSHDEYGNEANK